MIRIGKPYLEETANMAFLKSDIVDDVVNKSYTLWYSVEPEYSKYLSFEIADDFLLCMLQPAMQSGQDIIVDAPVSPKLIFHIRETLMKMLKRCMPGSKCIKISCLNEPIPLYNSTGVGCGCSLGVDSFSSILNLLDKDCVKEYRLTHLCFFNIGSFGDNDLMKAEEEYKKNLADLIPFSQDVNIPLVGVNSNVSYPYTLHKVDVVQSFITRTLSATFALQKLFGKYAFASSHTPDHFSFSSDDVSKCESALVPLISTNNTEIILADTMKTRVEKTEFIISNPYVQKYLDVCWARLWANRWEGSTILEKQDKTKRNCGMCEKCMRTLLTIEVLGKLDKYDGIFDVKAYSRYKVRFIGKVIARKKQKIYYQEIYDLMKAYNYPIPLKSKLIGLVGDSWLVTLYRKLTGKTAFAH